jgi:signal transduction histidine kinase
MLKKSVNLRGNFFYMDLYVSLASVSVFLTLMLALQIRKVDIKAEYNWFVMVMLAACIWVFFSIFSLVFFEKPISILFTKLSYLGIISMPVLLLTFALKYTGHSLGFKPRHFLLFYVIPLITTVVMFTNMFHGLFFTDVYPGTVFDGRLINTYEFGPWYWVHAIYSYILVIIAVVILIRHLIRQRIHNIGYVMPIGIMLPTLSSMAFVGGLTVIDYTPIMLAFSCLGFGWGISTSFYYRNLRALERLRLQSENLNRMYQVVVELSEQLIQAGQEQINDTIYEALQNLGTHCEVDRVYIFEYDKQRQALYNTFEWCREGVVSGKKQLEGISLNSIPSWAKNFSQNKHVLLPKVSELPPEESYIKAILEQEKVKSLVLVPVFQAGQFMGFVGFDSVLSEKSWDTPVISLLRVASNVFAASIKRLQYEKELIEGKQLAETANRAKSEFLANMSHELRTPLNSIIGFTSIVADRARDSETRDQLGMVAKSSQSLLRLINDLLEFSRAEADMMRLEPVETELSQAMHFIRDTFTPKAREKGLRLNLEISPRARGVFMIDESRLRQVMLNVVGNAVKFTPSGHVDIFADARPEGTEAGEATGLYSIVITVNDTGIGIAEKDRLAIFDAFRQVSSGHNRNYEGTGLGLAIARKMVELMNGSILVESEVGKGSTFVIRLPGIERI